MATSAFVDESKARGYILAATVIDSEGVTYARREMRSLLLPGQRRIHFGKESKARQQVIARVVSHLNIRAHVYLTEPKPSELAARQRCLHSLVTELASRDCRELVIERDDSLLIHDRRTVSRAVRAASPEDTMHYQWLRAHEDPMLWTPDAVAWCWAAGGHWRAGVLPMTTVIDV